MFKGLPFPEIFIDCLNSLVYSVYKQGIYLVKNAAYFDKIYIS